MARRRTSFDEPKTREGESGALHVEAGLNAARTQTRLKITGARPGGHSVYVIAERPDGRREDFGTFTWDGERGDLVLPFVARQIRLMDDYEALDRVETVIDVLEEFIEDIPQPEQEAKPEPDPEPEGAMSE